MRASLLLVCLFAFLCSPGVSAQDGEGLEDWQKKILKAIEASERDRQPAKDSSRYSRNRADDDGAARAAATARKRYGGKVLAVVKSGGSYRVRLLGKDGRVTTVTVEG
ncbi:MAG: hypothetical protein AB8B57_13460 [Congregibacter sp.]